MTGRALLDIAAELAYLIRNDPDEAAMAIRTKVQPEHKDVLIVALAAMVDIDRSMAQLVNTANTPRVRRYLEGHEAARIASYRPEWQAHQHGDRDPTVIHRARLYAAYQEAA